MQKRKVSMQKIREILRLHYGDANLSNRKISKILDISKTTVKNIITRFKDNNLSWPLDSELKDSELENL